MDSWGRGTITRSERLGGNLLRGKCESAQWLIPREFGQDWRSWASKMTVLALIGSQGV
jgi:hypothetical protein